MHVWRILWLAIGLAASSPASGTPARIVSLDYCADAYLLALADREEIAALSPDARQPFAYARDQAEALPVHGGSAEEILSLEPDLVLGAGLASMPVATLLERFGIDLVDTGYATSLAEARAALGRIGAALDRTERAQALLAELDTRLKRLAVRVAQRDAEGARPSALYLTPSGVTTGAGTYVDEVMRLAGLENQLALNGIVGWSSLDVEALLANPPDLFVESFFGTRPGWQADWRFSRHPVTEMLMATIPTISVPARQWSCAGYFIVDAAETLAEGRADLDSATAYRAGAVR